MPTCATCSQEFQGRSNQLYCKECGRPHPKGKGPKSGRYKPVSEFPFRAWDGEGYDRKLVLLANSDGESFYNARGMSTEEAFRFLTMPRKKAIEVWFAFGYDVNMMLRDLSWSKLQQLRDNTYVYWEDYYIRYIPRKQFIVKNTQTGVSFASYDVWGFFQASFLSALNAWNIPVSDALEEGKASREDFSKWSKKALTAYNDEECQKLVSLMDMLRDAIGDAGWKCSRWYGPGALAAWFLGSMDAASYIHSDDTIADVVPYAYFGGRIDARGWGVADDIYHYDITSAYPSAMRECPSLVGLHWHSSQTIPDGAFSLVHVRWKLRGKHAWHPFPFRLSDGSIIYPAEGEGIYWNVEIQAAQEAYGNQLHIYPVESWCPKGELYFPFQEPIQNAFAYRKTLKAEGRAAHIPVKLALNSLYGKTAQRVSFGKRPRYHALEWASYLTARTRAEIMRALHSGDVLCSMTDAVWSRTPIDLPKGNELGYWNEEERASRFALAMPGIYQADADIYSRGWERSALGAGGVFNIVSRFQAGEAYIPYTVRRFVGMGLALIGGRWKSEWRTFAELDRRINNPAMGTTKRVGTGEVGTGWIDLPNYPSPGGMSSVYATKALTTDKEQLEDRAIQWENGGEDES